MKLYSKKARESKKRIGFVPTMGYLHEGHLSLIRSARKENDIVVVSIFVNPTQFGPKEDLSRYPRDIRRDKKMCVSAGVDVIFIPSAEEMYPRDYQIYVNLEGNLSNKLCAKSRPGHFRGVATIVTKLFNIISPSISYFGSKDAQQAIIIKRLIADFNMDTIIKIMPIVREKDGLAMSSRNVYLSPKERKDALGISKALKESSMMIKNGNLNSKEIKFHINSLLNKRDSLKIDYVEIVSAETLESIDKIQKNTLIAIACFAGKTRLIDNLWIH
ncbi:pantoate--beta-alanine ligase [Candidatus Omnitrophus magneticus]|uniref:Pantothenate synthetase n=1 Tax=Candidatus Omnitrophus magneticus TaxID=1609969 RepID=A0A0F0CU60_9BACT|nr:pantoate--beta-alanine ligase [Candidatus Omnitrophus magneticus]